MAHEVIRLNGQSVRVDDAHAIFGIIYPPLIHFIKGVARGYPVEGRHDPIDLEQDGATALFQQVCQRFHKILPGMKLKEQETGLPIYDQTLKYSKKTIPMRIMMVGRRETAECRDFRRDMPMGDKAGAVSTVGVAVPTKAEKGGEKANSLEHQKRELVKQSKTVRKNKQTSTIGECLAVADDVAGFFKDPLERKMVEIIVASGKSVLTGEGKGRSPMDVAREHGYSTARAREFRNRVEAVMTHHLLNVA